jgi:hypothetical protein
MHFTVQCLISSWLQIQRSWVRFSELPHLLSIGWVGGVVGINAELLESKVAAPVYQTKINGRGVRSADHATLFYVQKITLVSSTSGGFSVGILRLRTKCYGVYFVL